VISHEILGGADETEIARVGRDLEGADIHVVCGARDLARQLPAVWQESLKNRRSRTFDAFVTSALRTRDRSGTRRGFWRGQDVAANLRRWAAITEPSRVHVVTLPQRGAPDELWRRFSSALGLEAGGFDLDVARSNTSLNAEDAEMLRRLNEALPDDMPWPTYDRLVKRRFRQLAADHAGSGTRVQVPSQWHDLVIEHATSMQSALAASGYDIVGDLSDLQPDTASFAPEGQSAGAIVSDADVESLTREITREASQSPRTPSAQARTLMARIRDRRKHRDG
jgi:hypothetical protein